jgi:hypothetical protein
MAVEGVDRQREHVIIPWGRFVEYLLLLRGWCAGLRPPTICAKSYMAYFVSTHYYMLRLQNGVLSAARPWGRVCGLNLRCWDSAS